MLPVDRVWGVAVCEISEFKSEQCSSIPLTQMEGSPGFKILFAENMSVE